MSLVVARMMHPRSPSSPTAISIPTPNCCHLHFLSTFSGCWPSCDASPDRPHRKSVLLSSWSSSLSHSEALFFFLGIICMFCLLFDVSIDIVLVCPKFVRSTSLILWMIWRFFFSVQSAVHVYFYISLLKRQGKNQASAGQQDLSNSIEQNWLLLFVFNKIWFKRGLKEICRLIKVCL